MPLSDLKPSEINMEIDLPSSKPVLAIWNLRCLKARAYDGVVFDLGVSFEGMKPKWVFIPARRPS